MVDIRKAVESDRGWIKKIQSFLPGYKKYRNCEDLRAADNILRKELASNLEIVEKNIKKSREEIARSMEFDLINKIGELVNISHRVTEKVRHAEQGYAPWISGDVRIEEDELGQLYDFDLSLIESIEKLKRESMELQNAAVGKTPDRNEKLSDMRTSIEEFEDEFSQRIAKVTEVAQTR